jgi:hypothetical protein
LFIFHYIYCINSLGPNFGIFNSLYKVKHINSTRKRVQSETQRKIHRKPAQFFENSTKLCEIYIDRSVKSRHFETELNMSLEHSTLGVRNCACTPDLVPRACDPREGTWGSGQSEIARTPWPIYSILRRYKPHGRKTLLVKSALRSFHNFQQYCRIYFANYLNKCIVYIDWLKTAPLGMSRYSCS